MSQRHFHTICALPSCPNEVTTTTVRTPTLCGWYPTRDGGLIHVTVNQLGGHVGRALCSIHTIFADLLDWAEWTGEYLSRDGLDSYQIADDAAAGELNIDQVIACGDNAIKLRALLAA